VPDVTCQTAGANRRNDTCTFGRFARILAYAVSTCNPCRVDESGATAEMRFRAADPLEPASSVEEPVETSPPPTAAPQVPDVVHYEYEPFLQRLEGDCRRIVAMAHSEAERIRSEALEESRRRVASAHREEAMILSRAADQQVVIYRDTQNEVDRRLEELERERASVLVAARAEAEARSGAMLQAAQDEARAVVARAREEAHSVRGAVRRDGDERRLGSSAADQDSELAGLFDDLAGPTGSDTPRRPALDHATPDEAWPGMAIRRRSHWWSRR
jgi:hypothetical protein